MATLAAVEDSHPDIYVSIDTHPQANNKPSEPATESSEDPPSVESQGKPVTGNLCSAVKHLCARGGPWARFRGLSMYIVYNLVKMILISLVPVRTDQFFAQFLIHLIVDVAAANLQMAWVHIVISEPSPKRFYQRIPGLKEWPKIAPVVALQHLAITASFYLPLALVQVFGGWDAVRSNDDTVSATHALCNVAAVLVGPALLALFVAIPAYAIFVRVAASMLPEDHEAIVPFDRSYGGKVVPAILGGSGKVGILDAWRTFDWAGRIRFFKVVGKVFAIELVLIISMVLVFLGQMYAMGPESSRAFVPYSI